VRPTIGRDSENTRRAYRRLRETFALHYLDRSVHMRDLATALRCIASSTHEPAGPQRPAMRPLGPQRAHLAAPAALATAVAEGLLD
jgi:hypothetical protein